MFCPSIECGDDNISRARFIIHALLSLPTVKKEIEFSQSEAYIIKLLYSNSIKGKSTNITQLSEALCVTKSSASQTVARLEKRKLVKRSWAKTDRRIIEVTLTAKGEEVIQNLHQEMQSFVAGFLDKMDDKEIVIIMDVIKKYIVEANPQIN